MRTLFICLVLAFGSISSFAGSLIIERSQVVNVQKLRISVDATCSAYRLSTYPGNGELMVSCPSLHAEELKRTFEKQLPAWTVLSIYANDAFSSKFLNLNGQEIPAADLEKVTNLTIRQGNFQLSSRFALLAVKK